MNERMHKYPRTRHLEGSRLQPGDQDLSAVPLVELAGQHLVIEEKLDGANAGLGFADDGELRLQSRGHFLTGGPRERHFDLFKAWAHAHRDALWARLGPRYVVYGEWLYAKHTIFYDRLPHYFLEFDILDRDTGAYLSTPRRRELLAGLSVEPVPVLSTGPAPGTIDALWQQVTRSRYKSPRWREALTDARAIAETDPSDDMEGLYIKAETADQVIGRYKLVRASFLTAVVDSGSHWFDRPIVPNQLADGVDLFA
jgi:hypothetical protein